MITDDTREIVALHMGPATYTVGRDGITRISAFDERGEMSMVPWFEVWRDTALYVRVNGAHVHVVAYKEGSERKF